MYSVLFNGLSNQMTTEKLKIKLKEYGNIVQCALEPLANSDKFKGTVTFSTFSEAKNCLISCLNNESLVSKGIVVNYAQDAGKSLGLICRKGHEFKFETRSQKLTFMQLEAKAKQAYGEAKPRPQDSSREILINSRRTNLGIKLAPIPADLAAKQAEIVHQWNVHPENLPHFEESKTFWISSKEQLEFALQYFVTGTQTQAVGIDFEFYNKSSYDGFIAVAVISTGVVNLVIDCLYKNFEESLIPELVNFMSGSSPIKIFHGSDNDALRLQKDFGCFPIGVVDLQQMFVVWKSSKFDDCFLQCETAVGKILEEKKKPRYLCEEYLETYDKPGLDFLIQSFNYTDKKDHVVTHADWALRPLPMQLLGYVAKDGFYTIKLFYDIFNRIGLYGTKVAANNSIGLFMKEANPAKFREPKQIECRDITMTRILAWREYLAKNLDKQPMQILRDDKVNILRRGIEDPSTVDPVKLAHLLGNLLVQDKLEDAAKLLKIYIDPDQKAFDDMAQMICHNCNETGHVAKFCFKKADPESKRAFRERAEEKQRFYELNQTKWKKYCAKKGWDPSHPKPDFWYKD